nr:hypothetical protein Iba_chr05aCG7950 [Ipomoea batatas]
MPFFLKSPLRFGESCTRLQLPPLICPSLCNCHPGSVKDAKSEFDYDASNPIRRALKNDESLVVVESCVDPTRMTRLIREGYDLEWFPLDDSKKNVCMKICIVHVQTGGRTGTTQILLLYGVSAWRRWHWVGHLEWLASEECKLYLTDITSGVGMSAVALETLSAGIRSRTDKKLSTYLRAFLCLFLVLAPPSRDILMLRDKADHTILTELVNYGALESVLWWPLQSCKLCVLLKHASSKQGWNLNGVDRTGPWIRIFIHIWDGDG